MVVSFIPGRIRLRFKELKNPAVAEQVHTRIEQMPGITHVEIKTITGSLLIEYDVKVLPTEKLIGKGKEELAKAGISLEIPDFS
jgi:hypothetical protein